MNIQTTFHL